jgi:hypothetical protein
LQGVPSHGQRLRLVAFFFFLHLVVDVVCARFPVQARFSVQEAVFLDGASCLALILSVLPAAIMR